LIKNLLFDNNGVLTTTELKQLEDLARIFKTDVESFVSVWRKEAKPLDDGRVSTEQFLRNVTRHYGFGTEILEKISKLYLTFYKREDGMHDLVKNLSEKYKVALLSNFGDSFDEFEKRWRTHETIKKEYIFVSGKVGMRKPNSDFYLYALEKLQAKPEETIFIDDRYENILAAEKLGIRGILFKNKKQFLHDFNRIIESENER